MQIKFYQSYCKIYNLEVDQDYRADGNFLKDILDLFSTSQI